MGHLTADERRRLETLLNRGESFRSIAEVSGKSHSTILREIRKHRTVSSKTVSPFLTDFSGNKINVTCCDVPDITVLKYLLPA